MVRLGYAQLTYDRDYENTATCVDSCYKYVDCIIIVEDGTLSEDQRLALNRYPNLTLLNVKFEESLPNQRQHYAEKAKKLGVDWLIVSDPDEQFCDSFWTQIRMWVLEAEKTDINVYGVNCRNGFESPDWTDDVGKLEKPSTTSWETNLHKYLVFRLYPDLVYRGLGRTEAVHETWYSPSSPWKVAYLPKVLYYTHRKTTLSIWRSAARNVFMGGGGMNVGNNNAMWVELRSMTDQFGVRTWREFGGCIMGLRNDSPELLDRLESWVKKGLTWKATDYGMEIRATCLWIIYHNRRFLEDSGIRWGLDHPPPKMERDNLEERFTRTFIETMGRWPDEASSLRYVDLMVQGKVSMVELPGILMNTAEYKDRMERESHLSR
jgi:hypothetical protein